MKAAQKATIKALAHQMDFWTQLMGDVPDMGLLMKAGGVCKTTWLLGILKKR